MASDIRKLRLTWGFQDSHLDCYCTRSTSYCLSGLRPFLSQDWFRLQWVSKPLHLTSKDPGTKVCWMSTIAESSSLILNIPCWPERIMNVLIGGSFNAILDVT